jgi:hypothetical protein
MDELNEENNKKNQSLQPKPSNDIAAGRMASERAFDVLVIINLKY